MPTLVEIERIDRTTYTSLDAEIRRRHAPFIVTDIVPTWKAHALWDLSHLQRTIGHRTVRVGISQSRTFHYGDAALPKTRSKLMSFAVAAQRIAAHADTGAGERLYVMEQNGREKNSLPDIFPELADDYRIPEGVDAARMIQINLWVGARGNITPLHFDMANNFLAQIRGRKRLTLFDPGQSDALYPHGSRASIVNTSDVQPQAPDFARHPKFKEATPCECVLAPGEMLYLPPFWWHQVESLDAAISINFWWKARFEQCLHPMGIQSIYYHYDRGEPGDVSGVDASAFADLAALAACCLERGHKCAAVLFAKAHVEQLQHGDGARIAHAIEPWRELLSRAESGDESRLAHDEVARLLSRVSGRAG
jgi:[protein]-arginine 3-hydroxylase / protease